MITYQPDIILLHIVTNDITAGNQDANAVNAILNVIDSYEIVNDKHVTVIVALIINRQTYDPATTQYNIDVNNMALNRIANGDDIVIVNMESVLNYPADLADGKHPNDTGYAKMAAVWYNALTDYLSQKTLTTSSTGGGSTGAALGPGEAYPDKFEMQTAGLLGWPPVTDIDGNGFIELDDLVEMCENWLESGPGDIDNSGIVDFYDFAEFGPAW